MKFLSPMRAALSVALGVGFLILPVVRAQNAANIRVVRLSRAEGQVLVLHAGSNTWEEAQVNLPLQEGDSLATQNGRAEIEFENGATGYLEENSVLQFTQLDSSTSGGRATALNLTQGAGTFYANLSGQDSFRVQTLTFNVAIAERAEFRVDAFLDGAAVEVLTGNVSVSTTNGSTDLEKGQSVAVHEKDFQNFSIIDRLPEEDAFDQWVTEEGEIIRSGNESTLSYIISPNYYGLSDLSIYGTWTNFNQYGLVWRPFSVGLSWTPFLNGIWILDPRLGWIWVSNEQWGWTPYHFGSWLLSPTIGWVWVPGGSASLSQWQPARVNFVHVGTQVGWVAMSPLDRDGAPANVAHGVITTSGRSPMKGNELNEIVSGKDLRNVTPLKQPPLEFASRTGSGITGPGTRSTIRIRTRTSDDSGSIVLDPQTHTFINSDGPAGMGRNAPVPPAALMPLSNSQTTVPRTTPQPPPRPADSSVNRVILPQSYVPASRGGVPTYGNAPARPPMVIPPSTQPRPIIPPVAPPRETPQAAPAPTRTEPAHNGNEIRPGTEERKPASDATPPDRH